MTRKYPKCPHCKKWTVGGANYCHHCGQRLISSPAKFNSEIIAAPGMAKPATSPRSDYRVILTETAVISVLAVGSLYATGQEFYLLAAGLSLPLAVLVIPKLAPAIGGFVVDVKAVWAKPDGLQVSPAPGPRKLSIEHIDEHGRPRLLYGFPDDISLDQLAHIGATLDQGKSYSRRNMVRTGKLSQPQYEVITGVLLDMRLARRKTPGAVNSSVELRRSGLALFQAARTAKNSVVVGGGWGTSPRISQPLAVNGAGEGAW